MEDNLKILIIFYFEKNMKNVEDTRQCNFWLLKYIYIYSLYCTNHTILWAENVSSRNIYIFQCPLRFIRFDPTPTKTICPQYSMNDPSSHEWIFCMISNFNIFFYHYNYHHYYHLQIGNIVQAQGRDIYNRYLLLNKMLFRVE